jgi:hypothetical protein
LPASVAALTSRGQRWELNHERCAFAEPVAFDLNSAVMQIQNRFRDGEPEAEPLAPFADSLEGVEYFLGFSGAMPTPVSTILKVMAAAERFFERTTMRPSGPVNLTALRTS